MTDEERKAFQERIKSKAGAIIEHTENPVKPNRIVEEVSTPTSENFSATDIDNFGETHYEEPEEEVATTEEYISQEEYVKEQYKAPITEEFVPKTKDQLLLEVDENQKLYEESDEELRAKLTERGFPSNVVESMVKNRVPAIDTQMIKEAIGEDLSVSAIRERFGGKLMEEAVNGPKSVNEVKQTKKPSEPKTTAIKPQNIIREEKKQLMPLTEDFRKVIREEIESAKQRDNQKVLLQLGDTIRFVVGDNVYEIPEIKFIGKKKK